MQILKYVLVFITTITLTSVSLAQKVICLEKEQKIKGSNESKFITTCTWGLYKSVETREPELYGRYTSGGVKLYKKIGDKYVVIKNIDLFKNYNINRFFQLLERKVKKDVEDLLKDPDSKECAALIDVNWNFNELEISFTDKGLDMYVSFRLEGGPCRSMGGTTVSFSFEELKDYLNAN